MTNLDPPYDQEAEEVWPPHTGEFPSHNPNFPDVDPSTGDERATLDEAGNPT